MTEFIRRSVIVEILFTYYFCFTIYSQKTGMVRFSNQELSVGILRTVVKAFDGEGKGRGFDSRLGQF